MCIVLMLLSLGANFDASIESNTDLTRKTGKKEFKDRRKEAYTEAYRKHGNLYFFRYLLLSE